MLTQGTATILAQEAWMRQPAMARFMQSGLNINALRSHTLLQKDDWVTLDEWIVEVSSTILTGIADLQAMGLAFSNGGIGTMLSQYHQVSDIRQATISMDPALDAERDRVNFPLVTVPVPMYLCPFEINARELAASRGAGHPVDRDNIDAATRRVSEAMEEVLFLGTPFIVVQGAAIYGYLNHPQRNTLGGADWGTATNIYPNVLSMLALMHGDGYTGPYRLYLHSDQYLQTLAHLANTDTPILRTIEQIPGFGPGSVREAQTVTAGQGVLVNMTRNCVDLSVGQGIIPIEWDEKGGMRTQYVVLACLVPRIKSTANGRSGIVHISGI